MRNVLQTLTSGTTPEEADEILAAAIAAVGGDPDVKNVRVRRCYGTAVVMDVPGFDPRYDPEEYGERELRDRLRVVRERVAAAVPVGTSIVFELEKEVPGCVSHKWISWRKEEKGLAYASGQY